MAIVKEVDERWYEELYNDGEEDTRYVVRPLYTVEQAKLMKYKAFQTEYKAKVEEAISNVRIEYLTYLREKAKQVRTDLKLDYDLTYEQVINMDLNFEEDTDGI